MCVPMWRPISLMLALSPGLLLHPASAQENNAAAERARLANQRIHAETERRARALETETPFETEAAAEVAPADPAPTIPAGPVAEVTGPVASVPPSPSEQARPAPVVAPAAPAANQPSENEGASGADLSQMLEQLRTLGELKDAGYIDDEEFERIKRRILDGNP